MEFLWGVLIFILDLWAIIDVFSSAKPMGIKLVWTLVILLLPVIGLIAYVLLGRGRFASST